MLFLAITLIFILIPIVSFANHGSYYASDSELDYSIIVNSEYAEIESDFNFDLMLQNKTGREMTVMGFPIWTLGTSKAYKDNIEVVIKPGQKIILNLSTKIPYDVDWYKDGDNFVFDLDYYLYYEFTNSNDWDEYGSRIKFKPKKIKLINIIDGSSFVTATIGNDNKEIEVDIIDEYTDEYISGIYRADSYYGIIKNTMTVKSNGQQLNDLIFLSDYIVFSHDRPVNEPTTILGNSGKSYQMVAVSVVNRKGDISNAQKAKYNAIFTVDNQYYGIELSQINRCIYLWPKYDFNVKVTSFEGAFKSDINGYDNYLVSVTNKGDYDIKNLYVGRSTDFGIFHRDGFIYEFPKNDTVKFYLTEKNDESWVLPIGVIVNGRVVGLGQYVYNPIAKHGQYETGEDYSKEDVMSLFSGQLSDETGDVTEVVQQESEDIKPTPTPQIIYVTSEQQPTPTAQVIYVTQKPAIPNWVWPALGLAIVLAGGLVGWIRSKQQEKKD